MINTSSVHDALSVDVALSPKMVLALQKWTQIYGGESPWLVKDVVSLNLGATIASEIARAVTIEMDIKIEGEGGRAAYLTEQVAPVLAKLRQKVELGCALGGMMMKPYVDGKNISVDFVAANEFFPIAFDANGNITSVIFSDQRQVGQYWYTRLEYHRMVEGKDAEEVAFKGCEIVNKAYRSTTKDTLGVEIALTEVPAWAKLEPIGTIKNVEKPLYGYFRFPSANNIDLASPLGISCFARAAEGENCFIRQADKQWSDLLWEFESAARQMYVEESAFAKDPKTLLPVLPNKRLYRTLASTSDIGATGHLFDEWSPVLREVNYLNGLDAILRKIEFNCGLSYGILSNPQTIDKTATEIKASQQRFYSTIKDTQKALENGLEDVILAMNVWIDKNGLAPAGSYDTVYDFDDSVVVDTDTQFQQDMRLVTGGLMSKSEFRMRNFGESEEEAKKAIAAAQAEQPEPTNEPFGAQAGA